MTRRQKDSLRALTGEERQESERMGHAMGKSVTRVVRAKALLVVVQRLSDTAAAEARERRSGTRSTPGRGALRTNKSVPVPPVTLS
jgi:hypothetical protein